MAEPVRRPLALRGAQGLGHLRFEQLCRSRASWRCTGTSSGMRSASAASHWARVGPLSPPHHQHGPEAAECPAFTRSEERREHLEKLFSNNIAPDALGDIFLKEPLFQRNYAAGVGTLFTAVYDPRACGLTLRWPGHSWSQRLDAFREGRREIRYLDDLRPVATPRRGRPQT
jgi:hypothetical protein